MLRYKVLLHKNINNKIHFLFSFVNYLLYYYSDHECYNIKNKFLAVYPSVISFIEGMIPSLKKGSNPSKCNFKDYTKCRINFDFFCCNIFKVCHHANTYLLLIKSYVRKAFYLNLLM